MKIGMPKEIKPGETRVVLTSTETAELVGDGHTVLIETGAGEHAGYTDKDYIDAGAEIRTSMAEIYKESEFIVKVKEIFPDEYELLRENQIIFTCLHPASNREQTDALLKKKVIGITAEDTHRYGSPNCEIAGKLGVLMGSYYLLGINNGMGKLVSGIGGVPGIRALVIGAGIVGKSATDALSALGAQVILMDINIGVLREAQFLFPKNVSTAFSNQNNIKKLLPEIDLVINCVKWPVQRKDHLITKEMLSMMKKGSVIVDISADIGGAIETFKPTTLENPTYVIDGVIHYGVNNIPAAVPQTASKAYAASVLPHIRSIANNGVVEACRRDGYLRRGLAVYEGILTHEETSIAQNRPFTSPEEVLGLTNDENLEFAPKANPALKTV